MKNENASFKSLALTVLCVGMLVLGITLTLSWWGNVVVLFKGSVGIILALFGMFGLFLLRK